MKSIQIATNITIPNTQQKVLEYGSDERIVGQTLLTAKALFKRSYLAEGMDCDQATKTSFDALKDMVAMTEISKTLRDDEDRCIQSVSQPSRDGSVLLPSMQNLRAPFKEFIQKAEHSFQHLYKIARIFYPQQPKWFTGLVEVIADKYGVGASAVDYPP